MQSNISLIYNAPNEINMFRLFQCTKEYTEQNGIIKLKTNNNFIAPEYLTKAVCKLRSRKDDIKGEFNLLDDQNKVVQMLIEKENEVQAYLRKINHDKFRQKKKDLSKNMIMGLLDNKPPRNASTDFNNINKTKRKLIISDDVTTESAKFELSFIKESMMIFEDKLKTHESSLGQVLSK